MQQICALPDNIRKIVTAFKVRKCKMTLCKNNATKDGYCRNCLLSFDVPEGVVKEVRAKIETINIDDWKPTPVPTALREASEWRRKQNLKMPSKRLNVSAYEKSRIIAYIKNNVPDEEILFHFHIKFKVLYEIKESIK